MYSKATYKLLTIITSLQLAVLTIFPFIFFIKFYSTDFGRSS